jgi:hypothetical protein
MNKIYKFSNSLNEISSMDLYVSNANSLIISYVSDGIYSCNSSIPFSITTAKITVPFLEEEEIMLVSREKIDLTTHTPFGVAIKNLNIDTEILPKPYRPLEIPEGFTELKGCAIDFIEIEVDKYLTTDSFGLNDFFIAQENNGLIIIED